MRLVRIYVPTQHNIPKVNSNKKTIILCIFTLHALTILRVKCIYEIKTGRKVGTRVLTFFDKDLFLLIYLHYVVQCVTRSCKIDTYANHMDSPRNP